MLTNCEVCLVSLVAECNSSDETLTGVQCQCVVPIMVSVVTRPQCPGDELTIDINIIDSNTAQLSTVSVFSNISFMLTTFIIYVNELSTTKQYRCDTQM